MNAKNENNSQREFQFASEDTLTTTCLRSRKCKSQG
jgi:hypothetical protein